MHVFLVSLVYLRFLFFFFGPHPLSRAHLPSSVILLDSSMWMQMSFRTFGRQYVLSFLLFRSNFLLFCFISIFYFNFIFFPFLFFFLVPLEAGADGGIIHELGNHLREEMVMAAQSSIARSSDPVYCVHCYRWAWKGGDLGLDMEELTFRSLIMTIKNLPSGYRGRQKAG